MTLRPKQGIAVASMICGIFRSPSGGAVIWARFQRRWPLALGIYQLVQIKNKPDEVGGKPFAIVGIATGSVYFLGLAGNHPALWRSDFGGRAE